MSSSGWPDLVVLAVLALLGILAVSISIGIIRIGIVRVSTATISAEGCINVNASGLQSVKVILVARVGDGLDCLLKVGTRVGGTGWKEHTGQL